jgi:hypothetical protein
MRTDAAGRVCSQLAADAAERTFGTTDARKAAWIRHGYLLATEELERVLDDHTETRRTTSSPHHAA